MGSDEQSKSGKVETDVGGPGFYPERETETETEERERDREGRKEREYNAFKHNGRKDEMELNSGCILELETTANAQD